MKTRHTVLTGTIALVLSAAFVYAPWANSYAQDGTEDEAASQTPSDAVIDQFESYSDGQVIGSKPVEPLPEGQTWVRFGDATIDNVEATSNESKLISGLLTAQYGVAWPAKFGSARRVLPEPKDVGSYTHVQAKIKSDNETTQTIVKLVITDGTTTYESKVAQHISSSPATMEFSLDNDSLVRIEGTGKLVSVTEKITQIGFTFNSACRPDETYSEYVSFDDIELVKSE